MGADDCSATISFFLPFNDNIWSLVAIGGLKDWKLQNRAAAKPVAAGAFDSMCCGDVCLISKPTRELQFTSESSRQNLRTTLWLGQASSPDLLSAFRKLTEVKERSRAPRHVRREWRRKPTVC